MCFRQFRQFRHSRVEVLQIDQVLVIANEVLQIDQVLVIASVCRLQIFTVTAGYS